MADADPRKPIAPTAAATVATAPAPAPTPPETVAKRSWLRPALMISLPLLVIAFAGYLWATSGRFVSTDNAYVQQDKVSVSADVAGRIVEVAVRENQRVKAGDLLFRIDPDPYRIAVEQAEAAVSDAQVQVATLQSSYRGTNADIQAAQDQILAAQQDYDRQAALMKQGFTTRARLQQSEHALQQAKAALGNARASADEARSKLLPGSNGIAPAIAAAQVQRAKATLDLKRTAVYAPYAGTISQSDRLQVGQMMVSGLPAVSIVKSNAAWVEANFKETDLNKMRVGQPAEVTFDAYKGLKLKGHVQSIGAGTGSEFSVLPAQNATGNWVKVTQRVPVRIAIDEASPRALIAGLSADVSVDVRDHGDR
ncbi:HlyD family secretion protein [Sphingomonas aliaeris]|uniref:HlyD family secretion protein n=1 Tax=Sphingomonas aliaeris TaxID=2759526 RepID=A0A974S5M5_9SPHN|nr:HlyD family secretion protein [Sphingomonas aliaeris]QQV78581.1 HlyD family secretion protein [Sphingomonas aliaeris]